MRKSKNSVYEIPYIVKGNINLTGLQKLPKDIYVKIGKLEQGKLRKWSFNGR